MAKSKKEESLLRRLRMTETEKAIIGLSVMISLIGVATVALIAVINSIV